MRITHWLAAYLVLHSSGVAAQPSQFDLHCVGTNKNTKDGVAKTLRWESRFRIDLGRKIYCANECKALLDIHSVTASEITLRQFESAGLFDTEIVGRLDGEYTQISGTKPPVIQTDESNLVSANCTALPFSGLPQQRF